MKRFAIRVVLHILLIVLLSIGSYLLFQKQLWFSTTICMILLIITAVHLYRMQFKQIALLRRLTDGLRYNDMMQTFHPPFKNKIMNEWAEELSDTLKDFRGKLLAEEIKHQYYENLLNKVDTAVLVADKAGHIEWMNQAAVTHLGQISQLPESLLKASATSDTPVIRIEQNNTVLEMAVSCTTFATQGREQQLISLKNIHSVLERNEMEAWQKLIRVLTHEIMNSVTPITSLSDTLLSLSNTKDEEIRNGLQTISATGKGLLSFVESYRRFTRIPSPEPSLFYVKAFIERMVELGKHQNPDGNITFQINISPADLILYADENLISQVVINLLKNAIQAIGNQPDGCISIHAYCNESEEIMIEISNNGPVIPPEVAGHIFIPFFTTKEGGSGIGLSISRQIMRLSGGSITLFPGKETKFILKFK